MAELTDDIIKQAKNACRPDRANALKTTVDDTVTGALVGGGAGAIGGGLPGALIVGAAGTVVGAVKAFRDIETPDASCVADMLQKKSRDR